MESTAGPEPPPQCRSTKPANNDLAGRVRSTSTTSSSNHRRSLSGSLLSRLSFLRMNQATHVPPDSPDADADDDGEDGDDDLRPSLSTGRAMSATLQQQRRTRRRRGSLRKTALLGTRLESRDKKSSRAPPPPRMASLAAQENEPTPRGSFDGRHGGGEGGEWAFPNNPLRKENSPSLTRAACVEDNAPAPAGEVTTDDDDDEIPFSPRLNDTTTTTTKNDKSNNNANDTDPNNPVHTNSTSSTGLQHIPTPSSSTDSYYALAPDSSTYRSIHRPKSPLATHATDIKKAPQDIVWDYAETEWWGWTILAVTWIVFVVGMGSCFEVWSWAWDVGETPYAPPELEDDPTLPIVGYYPALIILTGVMSWVWVVVAWVGMKYFKHANISGEDI